MHAPKCLRPIFASAGLAVLAAAPTSSLAVASEARAFPNDWPGFARMQPMPAMHAMDADKDGYVTKEEFMKFQEEFFHRMDKNKDGKLSPQEWLGHKPTKKDD
jgi:hypothetical protein